MKRYVNKQNSELNNTRINTQKLITNLKKTAQYRQRIISNSVQNPELSPTPARSELKMYRPVKHNYGLPVSSPHPINCFLMYREIFTNIVL